jgi:hypothetical protein
MKTISIIALGALSLLLFGACGTADYTCDDMYTKFDCEGEYAGQCDKDPYVDWAKENCGLGSKENPIPL